MNYKFANLSKVDRHEQWVIHHEDCVGVLTAEEAAKFTDDSYYRNRFIEEVTRQMVRSLLDSGAIKIETDYDLLKQHTVYAARLKYLQETK